MTHKVLFVCTGNYYRSRFAEMLFNALASRLELSWQADSRGLATEFGAWNIGPISPLVLRKLKALGVPAETEPRAPMQLKESDLAEADVVIALHASEHRPLLRRRFAEWADRVVYWDVPDLNLMKADDALSGIENNVRTLVEQLQHQARRTES
jgi:protein-tyrosine phosphatase